ncbi:MAG TPA: hotdog domain-containing protein [Acidimicrobiales bacterium]
MSVLVGVSAEVELTVGESDTAVAMRCGDVPVLATPRIVALAEEATVAALSGHLTANEVSVGTRVELAHLAPILVGSRVRATAVLEKTEGRRLVFNVAVTDEAGLVAAAKVTRVIVDVVQFMDKAR